MCWFYNMFIFLNLSYLRRVAIRSNILILTTSLLISEWSKIILILQCVCFFLVPMYACLQIEDLLESLPSKMVSRVELIVDIFLKNWKIWKNWKNSIKNIKLHILTENRFHQFLYNSKVNVRKTLKLSPDI